MLYLPDYGVEVLNAGCTRRTAEALLVAVATSTAAGPLLFLLCPVDQRNHREADHSASQAAVRRDPGADEQPVQASQVQHGVSLRVSAAGAYCAFWGLLALIQAVYCPST